VIEVQPAAAFAVNVTDRAGGHMLHPGGSSATGALTTGVDGQGIRRRRRDRPELTSSIFQPQNCQEVVRRPIVQRM